ncbi:MAG: hypothetical protein ACLFTR_00340 [Candidatus Woesearchaeota archaeon]
MAFDKSLDKEIFSEEVEFELTKIIVSVFSYNEGTPKLQIGRKNRNPETGEWMFSKLGRLQKDEAVKLPELIAKALEYM